MKVEHSALNLEESFDEFVKSIIDLGESSDELEEFPDELGESSHELDESSQELESSHGLESCHELESSHELKELVAWLQNPPADPPSVSRSSTKESFSNPVLVDAFAPDNLHQDLLRCPNLPEPSSDSTNDRICFLIAEYARACLLLKMKGRWHNYKAWVWTNEVSNLSEAGANGLQLWAPLREILAAYNDAVEDDRKGTRRSAGRTKVSGSRLC
jgi:hypothetical protein